MPRVLTLSLSVLFFAGGCGGGEPDIYVGSTTTTAVRNAPGPVRSAQGELRTTEAEGSPQRYRFVLVDDGSYRIETTDGVTGEAYDAATNQVVSWDADGWFAARGVAPGPPEGLREPYQLERDLARTVTGLARATPPDPRITSARRDGRDVWEYRDTIAPNVLAGDEAPVEVVAAVDRETGLALAVTKSSGGVVRSAHTVSGLRVNEPVEEDQFTPTPPGSRREVIDQGWEESSATEAARAAGFAPVAPRDLPQGYSPGVVSLNRKGTPTGPEGANPVTGPVVAFTYRHGLDVLNVTTRRVGPEPDHWSNPFGSEGAPIHETARSLGAGAFRGQEVTVGHGPPAPPFLWLQTGDVVVTVSGPLSSAELVRVAESLEPLGPA